MKKYLNSFLTTLSFFTRFKFNFEYNPEYFSFFLPFIFFIGNFFYILNFIIIFLFPNIEIFIIIVVFFTLNYYFFNLFHFDGYLDFIDAAFSQKEKEKKKEILKDVHKGSFSIFFGVVYLVLKLYILLEIFKIFQNKIYVYNKINIFNEIDNFKSLVLFYFLFYFLSFFSKSVSFYCGINSKILDNSKIFKYFQSLLKIKKFFLGLLASFIFNLFLSFLIFILIMIIKYNFDILNIIFNSLNLVINYIFIYSMFFFISILYGLFTRKPYLMICYNHFDGINGDCIGFFVEINEIIYLLICFFIIKFL